MNPDQLMAGVLQDVADDYVPVPPDLPAITAGGRRRRRARDVRRGVAAAAVVAVVVAVPLVTDPFGSRATGPVDNPRVERVTDLPVGDPPEIPYCPGDRTIRGTGDPVDATCEVMIQRGDSTLYLSRQGVEQLAEGKRVVLDHRHSTSWFPALSNDGRWAAWVVEDPSRPESGSLLAADLGGGSGVTEIPWRGTDGWVAGIDDLDRVYYIDYSSLEVWVHDLRTGETLRVRDLPEIYSPGIRYVTEDGFATLSRDGVVEGFVTGDGRFTQQHVVTRGWTVFSPDRSLAASESDGGFVVSRADGGAPVPVQLPSPGSAVWFPVWESDDTLIFQFDPEAEVPDSVTATNGLNAPARSTYLLRCEATTGRCVVALPPGWGDTMREPVYR